MKQQHIHSTNQFYFSYDVRYYFTYSAGLFLHAKSEYRGKIE